MLTNRQSINIMKSKIATKILEDTTKETKDKVSEYAKMLVESNKTIKMLVCIAYKNK